MAQVAELENFANRVQSPSVEHCMSTRWWLAGSLVSAPSAALSCSPDLKALAACAMEQSQQKQGLTPQV